jgi:hypothetical protein
MSTAAETIVPAVGRHFTADELRSAEAWLAEHAAKIPKAEVFPDALQQKIGRELEQASDKTRLEIATRGLSPEIISQLVPKRVRIPRQLRAKPTVRLRTPETERALARARTTPPSDAELRIRQIERGLIELLELIPFSTRSRELVRIADMAKEGKSQREIASALGMDRRKVARRLELICKAGEIAQKPLPHVIVSNSESVVCAENCTTGEPSSVYL